MLTDFDTPNSARAAQHATLKRYIDGSLSPHELLNALVPPLPDSSTLLVAVRRADYSASLIAKAVEDVDIQLLSLSVTGMQLPSDADDVDGDDSRLVVALRINARTTAAVESSLRRYGMEAVYASSPVTDQQRTEAQLRINELFHYLNI